MEIKNIYCVGRNYVMHAKELNNPIPSKPMIFSKPTHAAVSVAQAKQQNIQTIYFPGNKGELHYEVELVIGIDKKYQAGMRAEELIGGFTIGVDFTLRDVQSQLKEKQHPWLLAKGFINAAWFGEIIIFNSGKDELDSINSTEFCLRKNSKQVQSGKAEQMIFSLQQVIDYIGENFGLDDGDWIFTGTPAGVGAVSDGDVLELVWNETIIGSGRISLT